MALKRQDQENIHENCVYIERNGEKLNGIEAYSSMPFFSFFFYVYRSNEVQLRVTASTNAFTFAPFFSFFFTIIIPQ